MVLVDTSIWIDHFNKRDVFLTTLLSSDQVCIHPFIIGEIACGFLKNRVEIIAHLNKLPTILEATPDEVLYLIEKDELFKKSLGLIDIHLLASCLLQNAQLATRDKKLSAVAKELGILHP